MRYNDLHRLKTDIHLVQYAIDRYGYRRDRRQSGPASHALRQPATNDKVIVRRDVDGHWTYFSVRDDRDNGTIIDFVSHRGSYRSFGAVCEELRGWLGIWRPEPEWLPPAAPPRDGRSVAEAFARAHLSETCAYLRGRGIRRETQCHARFAGTWRLEARGSALFAHRDDTGELTGFEIKGPSFTGFSPGGTKSAWQSTARDDDRVIVMTESAIDALSYHQLHPENAPFSRYLSTAGAPSARQVAIFGRMFVKLSAGVTIVAAFDRDEAGDALARRVEELARQHPHVRFERDAPAEDKDWNDVLQRVERGR
jgi:Toprim domain-containing protein/uncharacterized protein DUF3991